MKLLTSICAFALVFAASAQVGPAGIVDPSGRNIQYSHDFAQEFQLVGPSGVVSATGENIQLTDGQARLHNDLPGPASHNPPGGTVAGASGYFKSDGTPVQLTHEQAFGRVLTGPSGIVFENGDNVQFRKKRHIDYSKLTTKDNLGAAGIVYADGTLRQLTAAEADEIAVAGPSGLIMKDGRLFQYSTRRRRSLPPISVGDLIGASGIVPAKGAPYQLTRAQADNIVLVGSSGITTKDGNHQQFRARRSADLIGSSGAVLNGEVLVQFKEPDTKVVLRGPSGAIFSDGQVVHIPA